MPRFDIEICFITDAQLSRLTREVGKLVQLAHQQQRITVSDLTHLRETLSLISTQYSHSIIIDDET